MLVRKAERADVDARRANKRAWERPAAGRSIDLRQTCDVPRVRRFEPVIVSRPGSTCRTTPAGLALLAPFRLK